MLLFQGVSGEEGYRGYPGDEGGPVSRSYFLPAFVLSMWELNSGDCNLSGG